jgi:hypothetical protein
MKLHNQSLTGLLVFLFVAYVNIAIGQITADEIEYRMWHKSDAVDKLIEIPEKWKDESAVILFKSESHEYKKQSMAAKVNDDYYFHQRIKMLDKAAVTEFSEFTFGNLDEAAYGRQGVFMGIKIVKPDGSEKQINVKKAVQMQSYKNSKENREVGEGYNKLAIPDLEIGDILDYYYVKISTHLAQGNRYVFDPVFTTLPTLYPIVTGEIKILPERKCFFNISVSNGAPKPVLRKIGKKEYYVIDYGDIERSKDTHWNYPLRNEPTVRFQIIISGKAFSDSERYFLGEWEIPKTSISEDEFTKLLGIIMERPTVNTKLENGAIKFIKQQLPITDTAQFIRDLYYYFRHYLYFEKTMYYGVEYGQYLFTDRFRFIGSFSYLLKRQHIDNTVFIGTKRYIGMVDSVVLLDEITAGIKVILNGQPRYIYLPHESSVLEEGDYKMEGTKIYATLQNPGITRIGIFQDSIPVSKRADNTQLGVVKAEFDPDDCNTLIIDTRLTSYGATKNSFGPWLINPEDYYVTEFEFIQNRKRFRQSDYSKMDRIMDEMKDDKKDLSESREDIFDIYLKDNYSIPECELDTLIIEQAGRFSETNGVVFSYRFSTQGFTKKAGDYLILDIGKLMGKNIDFDVDDRERQNDIYMDAPRQYDWEMDVEIPEGYYVDKTENLEFDVENNTGFFKSSARLDSSLVHISISKAYKHNYEPTENWGKMLEFLDVANDFYEQKLVFKKK